MPSSTRTPAPVVSRLKLVSSTINKPALEVTSGIAPIARPIVEEVTSAEPMNVNNVISIKEYREQDTIKTLERLLEKARAGEVIGLAYTACLSEWSSGVGATGAYRDRPAAGLGAIGRLFDILTKQSQGMPL